VAFKLGSLFYDIFARTDKLDAAEKKVKDSNKRMGRSFSALGATIAAVISFESARRMVLLADNVQLLDQRVRNATKSQREFLTTQKELLRISNETGTALRDSVGLFEKLTIAAEDLGRSNDQVLQLTEALEKLGIIGSSSQEEMNNAMRQFSQGMAGGILRAEEFNSIVENTPFIAKAIADGMGTTVGQLRLAVIEGKVLSDQVFDALLSQSEDIQERFKDMPITAARASQVFINFSGQAVSKLDKMSGATDAISQAILDAADFMDKDFIPLTIEATALIDSMVTSIDMATDGMSAWEGFGRFLLSILGRILDGWQLIGNFALRLPIRIRLGFARMFASIDTWWAKTKAFGERIIASWTTDLMKLKRIFTFDVTPEGAKMLAKEELRIATKRINAERDARIAANKETIKSAEVEADRMLNKFETRVASLKSELRAESERDDTGRGERAPRDPSDRAALDEGAVSDIDKIKASMGDETQAILNAMAERQAAIMKATQEGSDERRELMLANEEFTNQQLEAVRKNSQMRTLGAIAEFNDEFISLLEASGRDQTALAKALFLANRAIQVAGIIANAELQAAQAATQGAGGLFGISAATIIRTAGYARAGIVAGLSVHEASGGGRQSGGRVSAGLMHPVSENGQPELLTQGSRQFLLPGSKGGNITPASSMQTGGGAPNITVMNSGTPKDVESVQVTRDEVVIMMRDAQTAAVREVNDSLASGRGKTAQSLRTGFRTDRNL
jgi:tape measure domain-containing protein